MTDRRAFGRILAAGSCLLLAGLAASAPEARAAGPESGRALAMRPNRAGGNGGFWSIIEAARWAGREGYLAEAPPPPLRFSDENLANARVPMPALPEFALVSDKYFPYLVQAPLPDSAEGLGARLSDMVVDLEPRTVLSGEIDTEPSAETIVAESLGLDESSASPLRPEEVLIFFETDGRRSKTGAAIPFSPARPTDATIRSSAEYIKE